MPSMHTFTIEPIRQLICRYVKDGKGWIDPFAGENSPAEITNDLNPEKPAKYHMHALDFAKMLDGQYEGCLFDPPYSLTQVKGGDVDSQYSVHHYCRLALSSCGKINIA